VLPIFCVNSTSLAGGMDLGRLETSETSGGILR
jgi:hypothetical protein